MHRSSLAFSEQLLAELFVMEVPELVVAEVELVMEVEFSEL